MPDIKQIFSRDIELGKKQFRFDDEPYVITVGITKTGYHYISQRDGETHESKLKLDLTKLNKLLPDDMQMTKDHIIYILTHMECGKE